MNPRHMKWKVKNGKWKKIFLAGAMLLIGSGVAQAQVKINGSIFGGGEAAQVTGNDTVLIHGTKNDTIVGSVYGGGEGAAATVTGYTYVSVSSGIVEMNVYGGGMDASVEHNTYVSISGGQIGLEQDGQETVVGGNVYGGGLGRPGGIAAFYYGNVDSTRVDISDSAYIIGSVFGGGDDGHVLGSTNIVMTGGIVGKPMTVAEYITDSLEHASTHIYTGSVLAGGRGLGTVNGEFHDTTGRVFGNAHVTISGGVVRHAVYGGGGLSSIGTYITDASGKIIEFIKDKNGKDTGKTYVTINGDAVIGPSRKDMESLSQADRDMVFKYLGDNEGWVFGAGCGLAGGSDQFYHKLTFNDSAFVQVYGDAEIVGAVYGGGENGHVLRYTDVNISGGTIGGFPMHDGGTIPSGIYKDLVANLDPEDSEIYEDEYGTGHNIYRGEVYGGGKGTDTITNGVDRGKYSITAGRVYGNTNVTISDSALIYHRVYGGGSMASVGDFEYYDTYPSTSIALGDKIQRIRYISGGESKVTISGGTIGTDGKNNGDVVGGGRGLVGNPHGFDTITADNSHDGADQVIRLAYVRSTNVTIDTGAHIKSNVYGGSLNGHVYGNTLVVVNGGTIGDTVQDGTGYKVHGGWHGNVFGGGGGTGRYVLADGKQHLSITSGRVYGNTKVEIKGGRVLNNVYGGGPIASVGTYDLRSVANDPIVENTGSTEVVITNGTIGYDGNGNGNVFGSGLGVHYAHDSYPDSLSYAGYTYVTIGKDGETTGPDVKGSVYGSGDNGHVFRNTNIYVYSGTVQQSVFGAGSGSDTITGGTHNAIGGIVIGNTNITMTGGHVKHNVYGGGEMASVGTKNFSGESTKGLGIAKIIVSGGTIGDESTFTQTVKSDGNVFGGGWGKPGTRYSDFANVDSTHVEIYGDAYVVNSVYGGGESSHVLGNTDVNIKGGLIGRLLTLKERMTDARNNHPLVVSGNVYGGGRGSTPITPDSTDYSITAGRVYGNTYVTISDSAVVRHNVYGGGALASVGTFNTDHDHGDTITQWLSGGQATILVKGGLVGPTLKDLIMESDGVTALSQIMIDSAFLFLGNNEGSVYGSSRGLPGPTYSSLAFTGTTSVTVEGKAVVTSGVFGGGENGHVYDSTEVVIKGGLIGGVPLHEDSAYVIPEGPYKDQIVNLSPENSENYEDEFGSGRRIFRGAVFGGGRGSDTYNDIVNHRYGIFSPTAGRVYGNTRVTVSGGKIYNNVYGGGTIASVGKYKYDTVVTDSIVQLVSGGKAEVIIEGGQIGTNGRNNGDVFGGGLGVPSAPKQQLTYLAYVGSTDVRIKEKPNEVPPRIYSNVYGGSASGHVQGNTKVTVSGGTIGDTIVTAQGTKVHGGWHSNVYGGGGGNTRYDKSSTEKKLSISAGRVYGDTEVNIEEGATIFHNVYGGGAIASVGTYDLSGNAPSPYPGYATGHGKAVVNIKGGTIGYDGNQNGMVFGSCRGQIDTIDAFLDSLSYTAYSEVYIGKVGTQGPWVKGSVYGSGENGHVFVKARVDVNSGTIGVDSAEFRKVYSQSPTLMANNFPYRGNVYGAGCGTDTMPDGNYNPLSGIVQGETEVNINGGYISRNVHGAGAMASVGAFDTIERHTGDTLSWPAELTFSPGTGKAVVNINGGHIGTLGANTISGNVFGSARGEAGERYKYAGLANVDTAYVVVNFTPNMDNDVHDSTARVIIGSVYGSGDNGHVYDTTSVNIVNGLILGSVFGGGKGTDTYKDSLIDINTHDRYLADVRSITAGKVYGSTNVTIDGGYIKTNVYGGGNLASVGKGNYAGYGEQGSSQDGECYVTINGGQIGDSIWTGNEDNGHVFGSSKGIVYPYLQQPSGESRYNYTHDFFLGYSNKTYVTIGDGTNKPHVYGSVFGGGENGHVRHNTLVTVESGEIGVTYKSGDINSHQWKYRGNVYGAGRGIDTIPNHEPDELFCNSAGSVTDSTHVIINGGIIHRDVYGGGSLANVGPPTTAGNSLSWVEIKNGTIGDKKGIKNEYGGNVYGSSRGEIAVFGNELDRLATVKEALVYIGSKGDATANPLINGSVYGSGENGHVKTDATINIYGGRIGNSADTDSQKNTYCGNVFGAGSGTDTLADGTYNSFAGIVQGNTYINMHGGWVMRSIYGGGEMASVGTISNDTTLAQYKHTDPNSQLALSWPYEFVYAANTGKATISITGGRVGITGKDGDFKKRKDNGDIYGGGKGIAGPKYSEAHFANVDTTVININYDRVKVAPANYNDNPSADKGCIAGAVYGGGENGHVNSNTYITLSKGLIGHAVYGGGKGKGKYKLDGNDTTSLTAGKVYGDTHIDIVATHNDSAFVVRNVFGGGNLGSIGKGNYVGYGENYADGPDSIRAVNSGRTYVNIYGGTLGMLKPDDPGNAFKDTIPYGSVFGGCRGQVVKNADTVTDDLYGFVNKAFVTIGDSTNNASNPRLHGSVYGGGQDGHVRHNTKVSINGGEIGVEYKNATYAMNTVGNDTIDGWHWTERGNVYGGGSGMGLYDEDIPLSHNPIAGSVLGTTNVLVRGGRIHRNVYGGGNLASVYGDPNVIVTTGAKVGYEDDILNNYYGGNVFGAGKGFNSGDYKEYCNVPNTHLTIEGGNVYGDVYGGGENGHVIDSTDVLITDDALVGVDATSPYDGNVFGGGLGSGRVVITDTGDDADTSFIMYKDCGRVGGNTRITMDDGAILGSIFGGGRLGLTGVDINGDYNGDTTKGKATINVSAGVIGTPDSIALLGNDHSVGDIMGSGKGDIEYYTDIWAGRVTNSEIKITGSPRIYGAIFGGGEMAGIGWWNDDGSYIANTGEAVITIGTEDSDDNPIIGTYLELDPDYATDPSEWTVYDDVTGKLIHTCTGNVFGGAQGDVDTTAASWVTMARSRTSSVTINSGTIMGEVFGGPEQGTMAGDANVTIKGGTIGSEVTMADGTKYYYGAVYGGGYGSDDKDEIFNANNDSTNYSIYIAGRTYGNTRVDLLGGTVQGDVFGGASMAYISGDSKLYIGEETSRGNYSGEATILGKVYGANNRRGSALGNIEVHVMGTAHNSANEYPDPAPTDADELAALPDGDSCFAIRAVFGGGNHADFTPGLNRSYASGKSSTVHVYSCTNTIKELFGGGDAADIGTEDTLVNTHIIIDGGRFNRVFGGGNGEENPANIYGTAQTDIHAGLIDTVFGGGNKQGSIVETNLNMFLDGECDKVIDEIFGGSNEAPINGSVNTTIYCDNNAQYDAIYGGAKNADIDGSVTLTVLGSTIERVFGGSRGSVDDGADISGDVTLNIHGGKITTAFGGSDINGNIGGVVTVNVMDTVTGSCHLEIDTVYGGSSIATLTANSAGTISPIVNIIKATVNGDVYGGSLGKDATLTSNPVVNIGTDSTTVAVLGNVYGGGQLAPVVGNTTVNINQGEVGVMGYMHKKQTATTAALDSAYHISGGSVFGGGKGNTTDRDLALVTGNTNVNIKGGHVQLNVYGGGELASVGLRDTLFNATTIKDFKPRSGGLATVTVTGGQVGPSPMVIKKANSTIDSVNVKIALNGTDGYVFGGGKGIGDDPVSLAPYQPEQYMNFADVNNTSVTINMPMPEAGDNNANRLWGSIFGGAEDGHVLGSDTIHFISGLMGTTGTTSYDGNIFGGGRNYSKKNYTAGRVRGNVTVEMTGGQLYGTIFGGGRLALTGVDMRGSILADETGNTYGHVKVSVMGGRVGNNDTIEHWTASSIGDVFGGGKGSMEGIDGHDEASALLLSLTKNTEVEIGQLYDTMPTIIYGSVFGGGEVANVGSYTWNTSETGDISNIKPVEGTGLAKVTVSGGRIGLDKMRMSYDLSENTDVGHVFGGGEGQVIDTAKSPTVNGGQDKLVDLMATVLETEVTIKDTAWVKGSVYGGAENGHVLGNTLVKVKGGQIGSGEMAVEKKYTEDDFLRDSLPECPHWPYGIEDPVTHEVYYHPHDILYVSSGNLPSDGHTFFGNVFGGGSGYYPYIVTTAHSDSAVWSKNAGTVGGSTRVEISGGHILTNVYGGCETNDVVGDSTVVIMTGGTLGVPRKLKDIQAHPVTCYLFGSGKGDPRTNFNTYTNVKNVRVQVSDSAWIFGSVFGGGEEGHVLNNVVVNVMDTAKIGTLGYSYVDGNVFGAGRGFSGEALTAGTVGGNVTVNIKGGTMLGSVYGGGRLASVGIGFTSPTDPNYGVLLDGPDHGYVTINITGGTIGNDHESTLTHTKGGNVFGGSMGRLEKLDGSNNPIWPSLAKVKQTRINISGDAVIKSNVYGGSELGSVRDSSIVAISGGTVKRDVYGGGYGSDNFSSKVNDSTAYPMQLAGRVQGNTLVMLSDTGWVMKSIYGGGELASVGYITDSIKHPETGEGSTFNLSWPYKFVYAEGTGNANIKVVGGRIGITGKDKMDNGKKEDNGDIYGGGKGLAGDRYLMAHCANVNRTLVDIKYKDLTVTPANYKDEPSGNKGCIAGAVYGGGENGHVIDSTSITFTKGLIGHAMYGGGKGKDQYYQLKAGSTTEYDTLYSITAGKVYGNTHITIDAASKTDAYVVRSVFGGGNLASVGVGNYAGGYGDYNPNGYGELVTTADQWADTANTGHTYVNIYGGTLGMLPTDPTKPDDVFKDNIPYGSVFGGCRGQACEGEWDSLGFVNHTHVTIGKTGEDRLHLYGSVFGGAQDGHVRWNANTVVNSGEIGVNFGGSESANVGSTDSTSMYWVARGNVFGGGSGIGTYETYTKDEHGQITDTIDNLSHIAGMVLQKANVTINGGTIHRNVYGGGNLATVGPPRARNVDYDCPDTLTGVTVNINAVIGQNVKPGYGGNIFGGSKGRANLDSIGTGGTPVDYDQYEDFAYCSYTTVNLNNGANVKNDVFGGAENGQIGTPHVGDTKHFTVINVNDGAIVQGSVLGGGQGSWGLTNYLYDTLSGRVMGNTYVNVNANATVRGNVYGGGALGIVMDTAIVNINGASVNNVYGAGRGYTTFDLKANADVFNATQVNVYDGSVVNGSVYGGGENGTLGFLAADDVTPTATVNLNGGEVKGSAYGGGRMGYSNGPTFVNLSGSTLVRNHVFGGAYGSQNQVYVAGLRMVNMRGGTVYGNVYGGSLQADDALVFEPTNFSTNSTTEKACVVNISGGHVYNDVFGAGYFSQTYGSTYVFVGTNAIMNAPPHTANNQTGYLYNEAFFNNHKDLLLDADVWAGANFLDNNSGNTTTFGEATITGRSDVFIDGLGYNTANNDVSWNPNHFMNIARSVFGCGPVSDAGRQGKLVMIRNYGNDIQNDTVTGTDKELYSAGTRALHSIQYADSLVIENSHINLTGRSVVNEQNTVQYAIYTIFDKVRLVNGSSLYISKPVRNIGSLYSNVSSGDLYGQYSYDVVPYYDLAPNNNIVNTAPNKDNKIRINNGTNLTVIKKDTTDNQWYYGALLGFFHLMTDGDYNAFAYARPKQSQNPGNTIANDYDNSKDGGFVSYRGKMFNIFNAVGGSSAYDQPGPYVQMPYENHTDDNRNGEQFYRVWRYRDKGLSTLDVVLNAIAQTGPENQNKFSFYTNDENAVAELPAGNPGNYYIVKSVSDIAAINYGSEIKMVNAGMQDPNSTSWMYHNNGYVYDVEEDNSNLAYSQTFMTNHPNFAFGLTAIPTGSFDQVQGNNPWLICNEANSTLADPENKWVTNQSPNRPLVKFMLTHSNNVDCNYRFDPLSITLLEMSAQGDTLGEVEIHVNINTQTSIEQINHVKTYALMTHNYGGDSTDVFTANVLLPIYPLQNTLERSVWTLKDVAWEPNVAPSPENDTVNLLGAPFDANTLVEGEPYPTYMPNTCNFVGMTMYRTDNYDQTNGWWNEDDDPHLIDTLDLGHYKNSYNIDTVKLGETTGVEHVSFNFDLHYDGSRNVGSDGNCTMGTLKVKAHITNYLNSEGDNGEQDVEFWVEVLRRGKGTGYYIDGEHGQFVYSGAYPNAAQPSLAGIFNFTNFEPCDTIYIVNQITADAVENLDWNGLQHDQLNIYRYPGGHICTEDGDYYVPYGTPAYRPENEAYKGVLVDVMSSMSISSTIIDGAHLMKEKKGYYTNVAQAASVTVLSDTLNAEAPLFNIHNGGKLTIIGGDNTQSYLRNNFNAGSNGGAVNINLGGSLKMNEHTYVDANFVKDGSSKDEEHHGGGIYVAANTELLLSDDVMINTNKHITSDRATAKAENVYLADSSAVISIGTILSTDTYGPLNADSKVGVTKIDWRDHEIMPIVFAENTDHYANLLGDHIIFDEEPRYVLYEYPLLHPNNDPEYLNKLYWVRTWTDVVTSDPTIDANNVSHWDPSNIDTPEKLAWAISIVNRLNNAPAYSGNFTITKDINMSQYIWVPIGDSEYPFQATFEGNGYAVTGIHSPLPVENKGMFGVTKDATVQNLQAYVEFHKGAVTNMGGIIGKMYGGVLANTESAGYLQSNAFCGYIGGLVGYDSVGGTASNPAHSIIHSSFATNTLCGGNSRMTLGGLVAKLNGKLLNSYSNVRIDTLNVTETIGGLVGTVESSGLVENCYVGNIFSESIPTGFAWLAHTNEGIYSLLCDYIPEGESTYFISGNTAVAHGTYSPVLDRKDIGYMYDDNKVTLHNSADTMYYGYNFVADTIRYNEIGIDRWRGLLSTLNYWVKKKDGAYGGIHFTPWRRPTTTAINDDLPVLIFPKDSAMATIDTVNRFLKYSSSLDSLLVEYGGKQSSIFLYKNATGVKNVPTADQKVFINEHVALLQDASAKDFTNATVGITFDNSSKKAVDYYGNTLSYDWHLMSTPLSNAPVGTTYWYKDNASGDYLPHDNEHDPLVRYQTDTVDIRSMENSYFPNGLKMDAGYTDDVKWDFYSYYEPEYHWINLKRNRMNHFHTDSKEDVVYDLPYQIDTVGPTFRHYQINYTGTDQAANDSLDDNCVFTPGKGYMMAISQDSYLNSTGTLNKGDVKVMITASAPDDFAGHESFNKGSNLVGNPYQAYLDLNEVASVNTKLDKFWVYSADVFDNESGIQGIYKPYTSGASKNPAIPSRFIHPHQAFFVVYEPGDNDRDTITMSFQYSMATTDTTMYSNFLKEPMQPSYPLVNLYMTDTKGNADFAVVEFNRPEVGGVPKIDKLRNADFKLYPRFNNQDYGLLFTPVDTERVPVFFKTPDTDTYTLSWDKHNGTFEVMRLIDNITGTDYDMLTHDHYTFRGKPTDFAARFYIVFSVTDVEEFDDADEPEIFAYFNGTGWVVNGTGQLELVDMLGHVLYADHLDGKPTIVHFSDVAAGTYLLRLVNSNKILKTQKIVIY